MVFVFGSCIQSCSADGALSKLCFLGTLGLAHDTCNVVLGPKTTHIYIYTIYFSKKYISSFSALFKKIGSRKVHSKACYLRQCSWTSWCLQTWRIDTSMGPMISRFRRPFLKRKRRLSKLAGMPFWNWSQNFRSSKLDHKTHVIRDHERLYLAYYHAPALAATCGVKKSEMTSTGKHAVPSLDPRCLGYVCHGTSSNNMSHKVSPLHHKKEVDHILWTGCITLLWPVSWQTLVVLFCVCKCSPLSFSSEIWTSILGGPFRAEHCSPGCFPALWNGMCHV